MDGDGDLDIWVQRTTSTSTYHHELYLNTGSRRSMSVTWTLRGQVHFVGAGMWGGTDWTQQVEFSDFNGDGKKDILMSGYVRMSTDTAYAFPAPCNGLSSSDTRLGWQAIPMVFGYQNPGSWTFLDNIIVFTRANASWELSKVFAKRDAIWKTQVVDLGRSVTLNHDPSVPRHTPAFLTLCQTKTGSKTSLFIWVGASM
jgi:hypothetical protein